MHAIASQAQRPCSVALFLWYMDSGGLVRTVTEFNEGRAASSLFSPAHSLLPISERDD